MVNSMTGYGRCEMTVETESGASRNIVVEMKSVNHRFLEIGMRVTRDYGFLEDPIKKYISSKVSRGKIDVFVTVGSCDSTDAQVSVNLPLAKAYADALKTIADSCEGVSNDVSASVIARYPDVLTVSKKPEDEDAIKAQVMPAVENALSDFLAMRASEGERMKADVLGRAETIISIVEEIEQRSPQIVVEYKQRLLDRMKELLESASVDEQRIAMEAAIFADKIAVDEETVRLRSHFTQMNDVLSKGGAVGRKLDFIVQEMNREANTIGSKITDAENAHRVVDIKAELEKIREQIQNIE